MVWVDVEANPSSGCKWTDANSNCQFLQELVNALKGHGMHVGIYASSSQWQSIFGARGNCPYFTGQQVISHAAHSRSIDNDIEKKQFF